MRRLAIVCLCAGLASGCFASEEVADAGTLGGDASERADAGSCPATPCAAGEACVEGRCVPSCACLDDADCADVGCRRAYCAGCACFETPEPSWCPIGEACGDDGRCRAPGPCAADDDCPPLPDEIECGQSVCDFGRCAIALRSGCETCAPERLTCAPQGATVRVSLRSDHVPGVEVAWARVSVSGRLFASRPITEGLDLAGGVSLGVGRLPVGAWVLEAALLDAGGAVAATRSSAVTVREDRDLDVTMTVSRAP